MMKMVIPQAMMDAYHLIAFLEENQLVHFPSCREEDGGDWHFFVSELENGKYTIFNTPKTVATVGLFPSAIISSKKYLYAGFTGTEANGY
jgi:hypothetical protein